LNRSFTVEAYSQDLRLRVLADSDAELSTQEVAEKFRVSESWVRKIKRRRRETGETAPRKARVSHATKLDGQLDYLQQCVAEKPDATLAELRSRLPVPVASSTVWHALRRLRFSFKKSPACLRAASTRCAGASCSVGHRAGWLGRKTSGVSR
jgi:transposase